MIQSQKALSCAHLDRALSRHEPYVVKWENPMFRDSLSRQKTLRSLSRKRISVAIENCWKSVTTDNSLLRGPRLCVCPRLPGRACQE